MATPAPQIRENLFIVNLLMKACRPKRGQPGKDSLYRPHTLPCVYDLPQTPPTTPAVDSEFCSQPTMSVSKTFNLQNIYSATMPPHEPGRIGQSSF
jgi:hypothetical protein